MAPRIMLAALAATVLASAATAAPAGFGLEMSGQVPTLCRVEARLDRFMLEEACNAASGYEIYAEASPGLAGALLVVDGVEIPLPASGPVLVSRSDHADIATRSLELRRAVPAGTLTFRIVPL